MRRGRFHNWIHRYRYQPQSYLEPRTEAEIVRIVKDADHVRVFGSGHSFNAGVVSEGVLLSLDRYSGIVWTDPAKKQMAVRGGTRIRDINRALAAQGWAFAALPSHDAQSIGGILSTDVHGTGRDSGFVSQSVVSLRLVDGRGEIVDCTPDDDLFRAAIGGIGAVGIIVQVVIQAVDAFNVQQKTEIVELAQVEANLEQLLAANDHLSIYVFPFTGLCQLNSWNRTERRTTFLGGTRELLHHVVDTLGSVWVADRLAQSGRLPGASSRILRLKRGSDLVLTSSEAFNRTVYYQHHELEFAVPFEETFSQLRRFMELYRALYPARLPFVAFELRFTPAGHTRTLLGPGRDRRTSWLDLLTSDSAGYDAYLDAAEQIVKEIGARPHLGKYCRAVDGAYLEQIHGAHFTRFRELMREHDPEGKFANPFTRRLFAAAPASSGALPLA